MIRSRGLVAALVVVSDGADTASDYSLRQTRDILRRTDPFVYAIAIDAPGALASTRAPWSRIASGATAAGT